MKINISEELPLSRLLLFSLPTVVSVVFMSVYTIVDGIFIARFVGSDALSGLNIAYPCYGLLIAIATMFGTGGSAYVAHKLGQKKNAAARRAFSFLFWVLVFFSASAAFVSFFCIEEICLLLGADRKLLGYAADYLSVLMAWNFLGVLQFFFLCFFVTVNKPKLGLWLSVWGGIANMVLDYVFIVEWKMGISGAAYATMIGCAVPALGGIVFFLSPKRELCLTLPFFSRSSALWAALLKSMSNGSSEMISQVSVAFSSILINRAMMDHIGSDGVAAYSAALYCDYLVMSAFFGFSVGIAPHISYHFGANHREYLKSAVRKCLFFVFGSSLLALAVFLVLLPFIAEFFFPKTGTVYEVALFGLFIFGFSFLFKGINIFASALFTALGSGKISAVLAFSRTFVFIQLNIYVLAYFGGVTGIWLALPCAELMALFVFLYYCRELRRYYQVL